MSAAFRSLVSSPTAARPGAAAWTQRAAVPGSRLCVFSSRKGFPSGLTVFWERAWLAFELPPETTRQTMNTASPLGWPEPVHSTGQSAPVLKTTKIFCFV